MTPEEYFDTPHTIAQKQYDALSRYFRDKKTARQVADEFGYTYRGFTTIISEFRKKLGAMKEQDPFFYQKPGGRK